MVTTFSPITILVIGNFAERKGKINLTGHDGPKSNVD